MAPNKKKMKLNGSHMEFIQNMGGFHAPLLLVRFVPQDENYKKKGRAFKLIQPFPAQPSSHFMHEKLITPKKPQNDTSGFSGICTKSLCS
jgi:hypothetical protein